MTSFRLPPQPHEVIQRDAPLSFRFEGKSYEGFEGDTITSALAANGIRLLGRSFKYHRPRGLLSLANHDANVLMEDADQTNIRADWEPLRAGMDLKVVNTFGGVQRDKARIFDWFGRFLPVGFYYKAFHRPRFLFPFWERRMRDMAGLGSIHRDSPRRRTPKHYDFCDVLVIGGGPAGMSAAIAAAEAGGQVILVDEQLTLGGSMARRPADQYNSKALGECVHRIDSLSNIKVYHRTVACGCYADGWVALVNESYLTKVRAKKVVMTTGGIEQPAVFGNNDLPGIMLSGAALKLVHSFAIKPVNRAVLLVSNLAGYEAAADLLAAGVEIAAIVDLRAAEETNLPATLKGRGLSILNGQTVHLAISNKGKTGVQAVQLGELDRAGKVIAAGPTIECDGVVMSVGHAAADSLIVQAGGRMRYVERIAQYVPASLPRWMFSAGRVNGHGSLADRLADGTSAGQAAARALGLVPATAVPPPSLSESSPVENFPYPVFPHPKGKTFLDLDEDVQYKDVVNACQEGFGHVELMKRYSTFGMGPSQGKLSNLNTVRTLARINGKSLSETGSPRARPFVYPVPLSHLSGRGFHPHRHTPLHGKHAARGAVFMLAGDWQRPAYYAPKGESKEQAIAQEVKAVRQGVGVIDVGTLGKIEVSGDHAAEYLNRLYTGRFDNLKIGAYRYGLMCDESGVIIDDGIVARFAEDRFYVTTTTTAAGPMYREMQHKALVWGMPVVLASLTGAQSAINVAGPGSRAALQSLTSIALDADSFPYGAAREGEVLGVPARVIRAGFVGELAYEIHLPAHYAPTVWDALLSQAGTHQAKPFGVEAQRVLRLEKGHIIIGQDTDGLTHPGEVGLMGIVKMNKDFFVGQRSLQIVTRRPILRTLVGFTVDDPRRGEQVKDCHLIFKHGEIAGRVTSIAHSPALNQWIGLAFVQPASSGPGSAIAIRVDSGKTVLGTVVALPFYDPQGQRQKM